MTASNLSKLIGVILLLVLSKAYSQDKQAYFLSPAQSALISTDLHIHTVYY